MSDYQITELGELDSWRDHFGGFTPEKSRDGRRVVDHEIPMQFIGVTANSLVPGEEAGYWHSHAVIEELYLFLAGEGEMGLGDDVVPVKAGTAIRVSQDVMRTWRCLPSSPGNLTWLCIRGGGQELDKIPTDSRRITDVPMPWSD